MKLYEYEVCVILVVSASEEKCGGVLQKIRKAKNK